MRGDDPEGRPGVGDLHAIIAAVCGLCVFCTTGLCCIDPIRDDDYVIPVMALVAGAIWSGLFGLMTPSTIAGRVLAALGLVAIGVSTVTVFMMAVVGRAPF